MSSIDSPKREDESTTDLQNPSDALEILAQVADRAEDDVTSRRDRPKGHVSTEALTPSTDRIAYKPVVDGLLRHEKVYELFMQ